ncbi:TetR/AcrR family transcriptional regulator [Aestuariicella hydrocarbonica]|uniref:TetR/AcrR family transcriptional regulator n=1 Tax=Pseudomaricurvus hydrocarbonicus TaxID=1470433 RepID=A0A9E5MLD3_9GAMM|nr:TetR/AcrR family transcriptional regulator [Aestuariicella hydrocarbonica]NHO66832.1 TetR/AcrR family transcriptional regulator [Aestuariicella hydrocarbonica]
MKGGGSSVSQVSIKDSSRTAGTKDIILDAAEASFVERGYFGTSLRDITSRAGLQVALSYYHFGSKENLFRAVVERRAEENARGLEVALQQELVTEVCAADKLQAILQAFLYPVVERSLNGDPGWKNYIRLMAQLAHVPQHETYIQPVASRYDAVVAKFIVSLQQLFPQMAEEDVHWAFYFYQAAITHVLAESGLIDRQSNGLCRAADLNRIVDKMSRFFTAGFLSLCPPAGASTE